LTTNNGIKIIPKIYLSKIDLLMTFIILAVLQINQKQFSSESIRCYLSTTASSLTSSTY